MSADLKTTDNEVCVRVVLSSFPHDSWTKIGEAARLRVENKLVRSVADGRYDKDAKQCRGGALGTWATGILPFLNLKKEMEAAIASKLWSKNAEERAYVFQYFFHLLNELSPEMPSRVESAFRHLLKAGDQEAHTHLVLMSPWPEESWTPALKEAKEKYKAAEPANTEEDDIPF